MLIRLLVLSTTNRLNSFERFSLMPESFPPVMPDDGFDLEADLRRAARSVIINRHRDIAVEVLDIMIVEDTAIRAEYEDVLNQMNQPSSTNWLSGGIRVFEVSESPDGEMLWHGRRFEVVRDYRFHFVPNRPVHSIAPWALNFGGKS